MKQKTRDRILDSACKIFAHQGFRDTTIEQICRDAKANIAAVNYYYRNKASLYRAAWQCALHRSLDAHPPDGGVSPDAKPEARLRGRVLSIMQRITDPESYAFDIMHKEMANPTGLLTDVLRESISPLRREFMHIIRELLGRKATDRQVQLCHMSIIAQCFGPLLQERRRKTSPDSEGPPGFGLPVEDVEVLADHVTAFSLAGIRELGGTGRKPAGKRTSGKRTA